MRGGERTFRWMDGSRAVAMVILLVFRLIRNENSKLPPVFIILGRVVSVVFHLLCINIEELPTEVGLVIIVGLVLQ